MISGVDWDVDRGWMKFSIMEIGDGYVDEWEWDDIENVEFELKLKFIGRFDEEEGKEKWNVVVSVEKEVEV